MGYQFVSFNVKPPVCLPVRLPGVSRIMRRIRGAFGL
jgi:hypothetical protein